MIILKFLLIFSISMKCIHALNFNKSLCECKILKSTYRSAFGQPVKDDENINFLAVISYPSNAPEKIDVRGPEFCTGVILNSDTILTSGICALSFESRNKSLVRIGSGALRNLKLMFSNESFYRNYSKTIFHPDFDPNDKINNIAILKVDKPFELGQNTGIYPACIQDFNITDFSSHSLYSTGWGESLRKGSMKLRMSVFNQFTNFTPPYNDDCDSSMLICAQSLNTTNCEKLDAGHPLLTEHKDKLYVVGLMNTLFARNDSDYVDVNDEGVVQCKPGVINSFTFIYPYTALGNFINENLNQTDFCFDTSLSPTEPSSTPKTEEKTENTNDDFETPTTIVDPTKNSSRSTTTTTKTTTAKTTTTTTTTTTTSTIRPTTTRSTTVPPTISVTDWNLEINSQNAPNKYLIFGSSILVLIVVAAFILICCLKPKKSLRTSKSKASLTSLPSGKHAKKSKSKGSLTSLKSDGTPKKSRPKLSTENIKSDKLNKSKENVVDKKPNETQP